MATSVSYQQMPSAPPEGQAMEEGRCSAGTTHKKVSEFVVLGKYFKD